MDIIITFEAKFDSVKSCGSKLDIESEFPCKFWDFKGLPSRGLRRGIYKFTAHLNFLT